MPSLRHALRLGPRADSQQPSDRLTEVGHPPSSVVPLPEEVTAVLGRVVRVLSMRIDAGRIETHRAEVHREMSLMLTLR